MLTDAVTNRSSPFRIPVFSCGSENNIESRKKQKLMKILKQQQIITEEKLKDLDLPLENP